VRPRRGFLGFVRTTGLVTLEYRTRGGTREEVGRNDFICGHQASAAMSGPRVAIILPDVGAAPLVLSAWLADPGDAVFEGDRLVEVLAGGATFDVSSPATGRLVAKQARQNERLEPGQVLGFVEAEEESG
jgi:hypothetical protein